MTEDGPLFRELLWVHGMVRSDLDRVEALVAAMPELHAEEIRGEVTALKTDGPLWKLRVNCLHYCRFVHAHHNAEDALLFPAVRREGEGMNPIVDRLEADHRRVSDLLDEVEEACEGPLESEGAACDRLSAALSELAEHLLEHLDYEEESLRTTLNSWKSLPWG